MFDLSSSSPLASLAAVGTSYLLIALAEIGDKSQLVCMTLAARHRPLPILFGASIAFALLNLLAILFGATVASWLPEQWISLIVATMFVGFGLHSLRNAAEDEEDGELKEHSNHSLLITTLLLIFVAEFGDKTQIAVAGLGGTAPAIPVWIGATAALITTSALGIWAGRTLLQHLPVTLLHRIGGSLFIVLGIVALMNGLDVLS